MAVPDTPPTAEGDLAQTPFAHLSVFLLDRRMTGELFLTPSEGVCHAIRFEDGVPVKIRIGDGFARLGELLVEEGLATAPMIEDAVNTGGLLGDILVVAGCVDPADLDRVLDRQFKLRILKMYELPKETSFKYFEGSETLREWGGDPFRLDPLALLWLGVKQHGELSALMGSTIDLLGQNPLKLHPRAIVDRFELDDEVRAIAELLDMETFTFAELVEIDEVPEELVRKVVYTLAIARQLDLGAGLPVGVREERTASVAKLQLKSQAHRVGAALDVAGDGERPLRAASVRGRAILPRGDGRSDDVAPEGPAPEAATLEAPSEVASDTVPADAAPPETLPAEVLLSASPDKPGEAASREVSAVDPVERVDEAEPTDDEPESGIKEIDPKTRRAISGDDEEAASRRRLVAELDGMPIDALVALAEGHMQKKDAAGALVICEVGRTRLAATGTDALESKDGDRLLGLAAWAQSSLARPDLKKLCVELDDLIRTRDVDAMPRYARGLIRRRLGDTSGSEADFRVAVELEPGHAAAKKELALSDAKAKAARADGGFIKRLFRK